MINLSKKKMGILAIGTVMTLGAAFPLLANAATPDEGCGAPPEMHQGFHRHHGYGMFPGMEKELNITKADIDSYAAKGYNREDVVHAAFIAKASGQSLDKVLSYKTEDTTWKYVMKQVNVTPEQLKQTHQDMFADAISQKTGADKSDVLNLFQQGYHGRDIMMAAELAKDSSKSINDVIGMKKINNTWKDVASSLGVSESTIRQDLAPAHHGMQKPAEENN